MNLQSLLVYWSLAGFIEAILTYFEFKNCDFEEFEELAGQYNLSEETITWIMVAIELVLGGLTLPITLFEKVREIVKRSRR